MRSSAVLSVLLAVGALSSPLVKHGLKRDIVEDLTVVTITKYVDVDGKTVEDVQPAATSVSVTPTSSVAVDAAENGGNNNRYGYGHRKGQGHRHSSDASTTDSPTTQASPTSSSPVNQDVNQDATSTTASTTTSSSTSAYQDAPSSTPSTTPSTAPSAPSTTPSTTPSTSSTSTTSAAASTSVAPAPATGGTDYQSLALDAHNLHRANHSAPALTWSSTLADTAAKIASSCVYAHDT